MPERPRPDIEHTREALREHDERAAPEPEADEPAREDDDEQQEGDEEG